MTGYVLTCQRGVGDVIAASALVRDLTTRYPNIAVDVRGTQAGEVFANNPRVTPLSPTAPGVKPIHLSYKRTVDLFQLGMPVTYLDAPVTSFNGQAPAHPVTLTAAKPELFLSPAEDVPPGDRYGLLFPGVKPDIPAKGWPGAHWAALCALLPKDVRWVAAGLRHDGRFAHRQPPLPATVDDRRGATPLRECFRLIKHAAVVVCHVSMPMLVAAAFDVPCVVIAGGREGAFQDLSAGGSRAAGRVALPLGQTYLDRVGTLDCCRLGPCWAQGVVPGHRDTAMPAKWLCHAPDFTLGTPAPRCMVETTPAAVAAAVAAKFGPASRHS